MISAVIPARGGSKRIPRKNIKLFSGRPIIVYSIIAAIETRLFDRIIVSTDDEEIAAVARDAGAETPFTRPASLADDHTGTVAVIAHAVEWLSARGQSPEFVCCIYPTAPFLRSADLRAGFELLKSGSCEYAFSVTDFAFPIQRAFRILPDGSVSPFDREAIAKRSQDLEPAYHDAAQFYWGRAEAFARQLPLISEHSSPVILPRHRVLDIDTPEDWLQAELMYSALRQGML
jgi:N-acylneuraminate cytidylyltransferase